MNKRQRKKWLKKHNKYINPKETWDLMSKFLRCYDLSLLTGNVKEVKFNDFGIYIATDY